MIEIGQLLRQARESKDLSLADVEAETRIRQRYLNALESGDWDELPNRVAARGFLRRYAAFLGLDADELVTQFDAQTETAAPSAEEAATAATATGSEYRPIDLDLYGATTRRPRLLRRFMGTLFVLIPIILLGYLLYAYGVPYLKGRNDGGKTLTATVQLPPEGAAPTAPIIGEIPPTFTPTATPAQENPPSPTFTPTAAATNTPTLAPSPTLTPTPSETIRLRVVVTSTAWLRIATDGQVQVEALTDPGFDQEFVAYRLLEFLTGNAGGVQLTLNGTPMPPLGEIGDIVIFNWEVQDGQVVEITPTPLPSITPTATISPTVTTPEPTQTPEGGG
ncbi:MAG TPA: helix-turn-helix domain-containing protein [Anaerolineae bacterium]|nr:helix-turn-helix domain-containing protein [Anaerolineae bacterium]